MALASGLAGVVAAVLVAVLLVPGARPDGPGPTASPSGSGSADPSAQQTYPYPAVEDGRNYEWSTGTGSGEDGFTTEETRALDAALRGAFGDARLAYWPDGYDDAVAPVPVTGDARILGRQTQSLYPIDGSPGGPLMQGPSLSGSRPVYHGRLSVDARAGDGFHDLLTVDVVPKGSYRKGAGDLSPIGSVEAGYGPWLTDGCDDYDGRPQTGLDGPAVHTSYACDTVTTPSGLEAFTVARDRVYENGEVYGRSITVIVYLPGGNAVVVTDELAPDTRFASLNGGRLGLDADALLAAAEALPAVVVR